MTLKLMGRKRGMTQVFDKTGRMIPCTVVECEPNVITQIKTVATDGYNAVQSSYEKVSAKDPRRQEARCKKPQRGHFKKANADARKHSVETRLDSVDDFEVGQEFTINTFAEGDFVDVMATTQGKGFAGLMKKHNFAGGPAAHGSKFHRTAGSTGMCSTPGRNPKGGKRASRMGGVRFTVQNLIVVGVNEEKNVLLLKGAVPGATNSMVTISKAVKKPATAKAK